MGAFVVFVLLTLPIPSGITSSRLGVRGVTIPTCGQSHDSQKAKTHRKPQDVTHGMLQENGMRPEYKNEQCSNKENSYKWQRSENSRRAKRRETNEFKEQQRAWTPLQKKELRLPRRATSNKYQKSKTATHRPRKNIVR